MLLNLLLSLFANTERLPVIDLFVDTPHIKICKNFNLLLFYKFSLILLKNKNK